ncbi:FAD-binding oxidoreductase [bacterium]|nr:FAD-binding oxidoreductase [bacterium]MCI0604765.1 FAD-binding oxidoreductase [bacterium]
MYDLIVIGGGMSGISVAHFFHDQNILLLEKGDLLAGATGKNAGFLIAGFGEHFSRTAKRWGSQRASEIQRIHLSSHQRIRELTNTVEPTGSFTIGLMEQEVQELRASYTLMRAEGFPVEWLDAVPAGLREDRPGIFNPADGLIDSGTFWSELARNFPVKTGSPVIQVVDESDSLLVLTSMEEFRARKVVYCLNAFAGELVPELKGKFIPLRGQMLELEILDQPPCAQPVIAQYGDIYWNFTSNNLRFGGLESSVPEEETGIATSVSEEILEQQIRWIRENLHVRHSEHPLRTWYGTMAITLDGFPFVGPLLERRNQFVLSGMCGLGHSYALECASWLYELIVHDKAVIPHYFSSDRIRNLPDYTGGDWRTLYEAWNH